MWNLFSINKKESLVDILQRYTEEEIRKAIPLVFKNCHFSNNPYVLVRKQIRVAEDRQVGMIHE